jgi:hypothetical protein
MAAVWSRVNTILLVLLLLAVLSLIAMFATGVHGGPLDPPLAPGSTDSVRLPGTPISSVPVTINAPGHYYVTRNISITGAQIAITIAADDVSLDLGGFTIRGDDTVGSWGIRFSGDRQNVTVENGTVRDFHFGLDIPGSFNRSIVLRGVNAISNVRGFSLSVAKALVLSDCMANDNTETGIYLPAERSVIRDCSVIDNDGDGISIAGAGNVVESNIVRDNNGNDINVSNTFNVIKENRVGGINLMLSGNEVVIDNTCLVLTGATGNITAATSHQNVGC